MQPVAKGSKVQVFHYTASLPHILASIKQLGSNRQRSESPANPLKLYNATERVATKQKKEEQKIKVDGAKVKVKTLAPRKVRPVYYCQICDRSFPSQLDLEEHVKIDHSKKIAVT